MTKDNKHIDLIEGFLQNSLTDSELEAFEELLIADEEFGQLFIDTKTVVDGIRFSASKTTLEEKLKRLEGLEKLEAVKQDEQSEKKNEGIIIVMFNYLDRRRWAVAAGFTFFVVAAVLLTNINSGSKGDKLFAEYFFPFKDGGTYSLMRGDSIEENDRSQAFYYYDIEEFTLANEYFDKVLDYDINSIMALFYSGNALLAIDHVNEAIERFKQVISMGQGLEIQAKWYLVLCYLKLENYTEMTPLLNEIIDSNTRYSERAKELLRKIS